MAQPIEPQEALPSTITKLPIQEGPQRAGINQLFQQGLQYFNPATQEEYTRRQFAQRLPGLAERLNMQSGGQGMSQAAQYEFGAQQAGLENQILGQRYQHGLNALKLGLTPQYEYLYKEPPLSFKDALLGNLAASAGQQLPGIAAKGAEYLANKISSAGEAAATLAPAGVEALKSAFPSPQAPNVMQAGAPQDVSKLAQAATLLKKAGPEAAAAAAPSAIQALKSAAAPGSLAPAAQSVSTAAKAAPAFLDTAKAVAKYGVQGAAALTGAYAFYELLQYLDRRFTPPGAPLMSETTPESRQAEYERVLANQVTTPGGQVTRQEIEKKEKEKGIKPKAGATLDERFKAAFG